MKHFLALPEPIRFTIVLTGFILMMGLVGTLDVQSGII